jgi:hypothetical protein
VKNPHEMGSEKGNAEKRRTVVLNSFRSWLAALDDFRNWLIREAA